jgi:hypothetical protein
MPISYTHDTARRITVVTWSGTVTAREFADHYRLLLTDDTADGYRRCIADLRNCVIDISGEQIRDAIQTTVKPLLGSRPWRSAILVNDPVAFGISRQYAAYSQAFSQSQIFSDEREGLAWLLIEGVVSE